MTGRNELITRFWDIFHEIFARKSTVFFLFFLFFYFFFAFFTNLRPEKNEPVTLFWLFSRICDQKGMNLFLGFWLLVFSKICDQKGMS